MSRFALRQAGVLIVLALIGGCNANPSATAVPSGGNASPSATLATASAGATATPTPTLSLGPTETVGGTAQATVAPTQSAPAATPTPSVAPTPTEPPAASAGRPDGRIRLRELGYRDFDSHQWDTEVLDRPWLGNDVYNATGRNQTAKESYSTTTPAEAISWRFAISIENDGDAADRFLVEASGPALPDGYCFDGTCYKWKLDWFRDATKITAAVADGTYKTALLAPGDSEVIVAELTTDTYNGDVTRLLTITSAGDSSRQDVVKIVVKKGAACGC